MNYGNFFLFLANMDKNNRFLLSMIGIIAFLLILIIVISLIAKSKEKKATEIINEKRREIKRNFKKNVKPLDFSDIDKEISPSVNLVSEKTEQIELPQIKKEIKVEPIKVEDTKPTVEEEIIEVMDDSVDDEIENIKESIKKNMGENTINLNKWEQEQEESAIISYDELVKRAGAKKIIYKSAKKEEPKLSEQKSTAGFRPSQIVSPIYGVQKSIKKMDEEISSFNRIEKLKLKNNDEEMDNDVEFLNKLKKFRSELN